MRSKLFALALLSTFLISGTAYAGGGCGKDKGDCGGCPILSKIAFKTEKLLDHKDELGLSGDQVKTLKDIQLTAEKAGVTAEADMKMFMTELKAKLKEETINLDDVNGYIDQSFSKWAATTKTHVEWLAKVKGVLTPEQKEKMKELKKKKHGGDHKDSDEKDEAAPPAQE